MRVPPVTEKSILPTSFNQACAGISIHFWVKTVHVENQVWCLSFSETSASRGWLQHRREAGNVA